MAIIVENGTGLSNAQCYCSYAQYHAVITELGWTHSHSEEQTETAIVSAAKLWLDGEHNFRGNKLVSTQALKFPTDIDGLPADIVRANAIATWYQLNSVLLPDPLAVNKKGDVIREKKKLDVLETETEYAPGTSKYMTPDLPSHLINLISPYFKQYTGFGRNVRLL